MNDEHQALAVTTATAVARCGVAIWRLSSKNSDHCDDAVVGSDSTSTTMLEEYYSCNNVIPLSEGENWVTLCAVKDEMVDGFRDPSKATKTSISSSSITIVKGNDDIIVDSNAVLCIDVDNDGPCGTVKDVRTETTNDNDVDCRTCFYLARRKKALQCGGGITGRGGGTGGGGSNTMLYRKTSTTRVNSNSPPREVDVKDATSNDESPSSQFLYDSSEPLPPRQLRLLHDGDRILIRKIDHQRQGCTAWGVKLEYLQNMEKVAVAISGRDDRKVEVNGTTTLTRIPTVKSDSPTKEKQNSMHFAGATPMTNDDDDLVHSEDELLSQPDCSHWKERRRIETEEEKMEAPPKHLSLHRNTKNTSQSISATTLNFDDDEDSTECSNDDEVKNEEKLNHNVIDKSAVYQSEAKDEDEDDSTECPDDDDAEMGERTLPTENIQKATCAIIKLSSTTCNNECINENTPAESAANQAEPEDKDDVKDDSPECHQGVELKLARETDLTTIKSVNENIDSKDSANSSFDLQTSVIGNGVSNPNAEDAADLYATKEVHGAREDSAECHYDDEDERNRSTDKDLNDSTNLRHNTTPPTDLPTKSTDIAANSSTGDVMEYQAETLESLDECFQAETQALFFPSTNTLEKINIDEEENRSALPAKPDPLCATELKNGPPPHSPGKSDHPANILHHSLSPRDRKRKRSLSKSRRESSDTIKIVFTSIVPTRRHKQMIHDIGAQLVDTIEEASSATHVIASDGRTKLRRTPKLMICVCKTPNILSIDWLEQSAKEKSALATDKFLLLNDTEAEKTYNFSMKATLENGKKARATNGGILGGWSVYICRGVAGKNAPSTNEFAPLIEATGATLLQSLLDVPTPKKTIVITGDPITKDQRSEEGVKGMMRRGAKLLTTTWLFHTIITQQLCFIGKEQSTPASGRSKQKAVTCPPDAGVSRKSSRNR